MVTTAVSISSTADIDNSEGGDINNDDSSSNNTNIGIAEPPRPSSADLQAMAMPGLFSSPERAPVRLHRVPTPSPPLPRTGIAVAAGGGMPMFGVGLAAAEALAVAAGVATGTPASRGEADGSPGATTQSRSSSPPRTMDDILQGAMGSLMTRRGEPSSLGGGGEAASSGGIGVSGSRDGGGADAGIGGPRARPGLLRFRALEEWVLVTQVSYSR